MRVSDSKYRARYKRAIDLALLLGAHVTLLPLWLILWTVIPVAVVVDSGFPVFYRQQRIGQGGKRFSALKFRTMVRQADRIGPAHTTANDPRLTRVGRVLRRSALDELPQVINILRGDMSFVGPRALSTADIEEMEIDPSVVERRTSVPAGLTGLAQLYSNRADTPRKLALDLEYIDRMGPWLDAKLMLLSVLRTVHVSWDESEETSAESPAESRDGRSRG